MAKTTIRTYLTLDNSPFDAGLNKAITGAKKFKENFEAIDKKTGGVFGGTLSALAKFAGAAGIAVGGFELLKNAINSTQILSDNLAIKFDMVKGSLDGLFVALSTGNMDGFLSNIKKVADAAASASVALDNLGTAQLNFSSLMAQNSNKLAAAQEELSILRLKLKNPTVKSDNEELKRLAAEEKQLMEVIDTELDAMLKKHENLGKHIAAALSTATQRELLKFGFDNSQLNELFAEQVKLGVYLDFDDNEYKEMAAKWQEEIYAQNIKRKNRSRNYKSEYIKENTNKLPHLAYAYTNMSDSSQKELAQFLESYYKNERTITQMKNSRTQEIWQTKNAFEKADNTNERKEISLKKNILKDEKEIRISKLNSQLNAKIEEYHSLSSNISSEKDIIKKDILEITNELKKLEYSMNINPKNIMELNSEISKFKVLFDVEIDPVAKKNYYEELRKLQQIKLNLFGEVKIKTPEINTQLNIGDNIDISNIDKEITKLNEKYYLEKKLLEQQKINSVEEFNTREAKLRTLDIEYSKKMQLLNIEREYSTQNMYDNKISSAKKLAEENVKLKSYIEENIATKVNAANAEMRLQQIETEGNLTQLSTINELAGGYAQFMAILSNSGNENVSQMAKVVNAIMPVISAVLTLAMAESAEKGASAGGVVGLIVSIAGAAAAIASMPKYATGGIVGGNSYVGDNVAVRVNSGEMILNKAQQANLFKLLNSTKYEENNNANMTNIAYNSNYSSDVQFVLRGDELIGLMNNNRKKYQRKW